MPRRHGSQKSTNQNLAPTFVFDFLRRHCAPFSYRGTLHITAECTRMVYLLNGFELFSWLQKRFFRPLAGRFDPDTMRCEKEIHCREATFAVVIV